MTLAKDLDEPNGVALRDGALYVAEVGRILRFDGIEARLEEPAAPVVVTDSFPKDGHHGWKFIALRAGRVALRDGRRSVQHLQADDPRYAAIMRMQPDGTGCEVFARGVRNTWASTGTRPRRNSGSRTTAATGWATTPPGRAEPRAPAGMHFGYPCCHGKNLEGPGVRQGAPRSDSRHRRWSCTPHVAALGMRFYTGTVFPPEYRGRIFIAEHGSWNRTKPVGYRVVTVPVRAGQAGPEAVFAEGWLQGRRPGAGRWTCWCCPTAPSSCPTTRREPSTGSPSPAERGRPAL